VDDAVPRDEIETERAKKENFLSCYMCGEIPSNKRMNEEFCGVCMCLEESCGTNGSTSGHQRIGTIGSGSHNNAKRETASGLK